MTISAASELPHGAKAWILGARLRTLPASLVPVLIGTSAAVAAGGEIWWRAVVAGVVALALQVGTNYANDYSDGVRGTDDARVGPLRLTATGIASPTAVKTAAMAAFGVAGLAGLALAAVAGWWLVAVGAACIAAGYLYTGGPRPYGYAGLGEVFVFIFFGLVAACGTTYVQAGRLTLVSLLGAVAAGILAVSMLVVNNLRDIDTDRVAGKMTLSVRIGDTGSRWLYIGCLALPYLMALAAAFSGRWWALLALLSLPLAVEPVRAIRRGAEGRELIAVLGATGRLQLAFGVLMAVGLGL